MAEGAETLHPGEGKTQGIESKYLVGRNDEDGASGTHRGYRLSLKYKKFHSRHKIYIYIYILPQQSLDIGTTYLERAPRGYMEILRIQLGTAQSNLL